MSDTVGLMARPKKKPAKPPVAGRSIGIRVSIEYGEWVERLAKHNRSSVSVLFDQAMSSFAKAIGFTEEPPER